MNRKKPLTSEERINEILAGELSSGFIWGELNDQVNRWISRINEHGVTKWWRGRKAGVTEVESLLFKGELLHKKEGPGLEILQLWFFAHDGFTSEAETLMAEKGVLWSDRDDLDSLLS